MNEITSSIAAAVEEQGAATQEIARSVTSQTEIASLTPNGQTRSFWMPP
jgi:methyl-accepting chemotaxis protein